LKGISIKICVFNSPVEVSVGKVYRVSIDALRDFPWSRYVRFAFLFGSAVLGSTAGDVDIAISRVSLETLGELLAELVKSIHIPEDYIDLVIITERTPCPLVLEAFKGMPLYVADWDEVYRYFNVCQDQQIDSRKLRLIETAVDAVWRR